MGLIYSQNWSRGNSSFSTFPNAYAAAYWGRVNPESQYPIAFPSEGQPADPLYPELIANEAATVFIGTGPTGQNVLDLDVSTRPDEAYWSAGGVLGDFGTLAGSGPHNLPAHPSNPDPKWWNGAIGRASVLVKFVDQAWTDGTYAELLRLQVSYFDHTGGIGIDFDTDTNEFLLFVRSTAPGGISTSVISDFSYTSSQAVLHNVWHLIELRWRCGPGGYAQFYLDGILIYNHQAQNFHFNTDPATPDYLRMVWFGFSGMMGPTTDIKVYDTDALAPATFVPSPTALSGQADCNPQSQVSGVVKGQFGCNVGGIGASWAE